MNGTVTEIRQSEREFDFTAKIGSRDVSRTYPFDKVHAVTYRGKRYVLTKKSESASVKRDDNGNPLRSVTEINRVIKEAGENSPDWFESARMDYPDTLDLSWPLKPEGGWNNKKNMGQFIWDVINPNPGRWKGGIKLVHHCLDLHQGQASLVKRDKGTLGRMYFDLLQDYPRAAYWLRQSGVQKGQGPAVMLAECYWRLGNKRLATQQLVSRTYNAGAAARAIKLYANMGMNDEALKMTERLSNSNAAYEGYISAGDAMRQAGRYDQAIKFYNRVLDNNQFRNEDYAHRFRERARESIEAIELFETAEVSSLTDGIYEGDSTGYNGKLEVAVTISGGEIKSVKVTKHREKQFYSALTDTERSILELQTVRGVDGTSGATITSRAIVNAAAKAMAGEPK